MKKYTADEVECYETLINDLAENMSMKRYTHNQLCECISYLADNRYELGQKMQSFKSDVLIDLCTLTTKVCAA